MNTLIRRWCDTCQKITASWLDALGTERCSGCDPENRQRPGHGVRDTDRIHLPY